MANRAYLYAIDTVPPDPDSHQIIGLGEFNWDIPLTFKILVSVDARPVKSAIFGVEEAIAISADFDDGVKRFFAFLDRLEHPGIAAYVAEARAWFALPHNRYDHLLLEAGEMFDLVGDDLVTANLSLLSELTSLDQVIDAAVEEINSGNAETFEPFGFGVWSNVLYFKPAGTVEPPTDLASEHEYTTLVRLTEALPRLHEAQFVGLNINCEGDTTGLAEVLRRLAVVTSLTTLGFDNLGGHLPPEIGQLRQIRRLRLNGNGLAELPAELGQLGHLELLNVNHNPLRTLPVGISADRLWTEGTKIVGQPAPLAPSTSPPPPPSAAPPSASAPPLPPTPVPGTPPPMPAPPPMPRSSPPPPPPTRPSTQSPPPPPAQPADPQRRQPPPPRPGQESSGNRPPPPPPPR